MKMAYFLFIECLQLFNSFLIKWILETLQVVIELAEAGIARYDG